MQRRQSSTESPRISRPPNPGIQNNSRRAVSEQRPPKSRPRHILEDPLSKASIFISPERQGFRTRPSIVRFQAFPKSSSLLTRTVVPPSRAPSSFAQVELRKKLLEENIKLAKSLSGLKKQTSVSRNGWETVWRNRAILDNFFGYDWDTNPRLHKRNSKTLAADIGKDSAAAKANIVQEEHTYSASTPTTSSTANRVIQPIAQGSEPTINQTEANGCSVSCSSSCDTEGQPLKEIQDWMKKQMNCAFRYGTSQLDLKSSIARVGQSPATTEQGFYADLVSEDQIVRADPRIIEAIPLHQKYTSRQTDGDAIQIKVGSAEVSLRNIANETLDSSPAPSKIAVVSSKNLTDLQSMDFTQTISSMKRPNEECKVEETMPAELLDPNFSKCDLTFSEKAALKVIEYQSQQIKALMKIAQQKSSHQLKPEDTPKKSDGTVSKSLASYWNEARLLSWAKECKVQHQVEVNENDSTVSIGSSVPSAFDSDVILPIATTVTPSMKLETLDSLDSPNSLVGVSTHNLIPSDTSFSEIANRNFTNKPENEMPKPALVASSDEPLSSLRPSVDLPRIKTDEIRTNRSVTTETAKVGPDQIVDVDNNVNLPKEGSNNNSSDKAPPPGAPTDDHSALLDFCASNDDTTAASTGTTPTVRSTLVVNSSSQTLAQAKNHSTSDAFKHNHGILLETFSQGNFLDNTDVYDDGSDETKSLDGQHPAGASNQLTSINPRKTCKARRIRRRVSFSNRVALCPAKALINGQFSTVSKDQTHELERKLQLSFRYPQNSHSVGCLRT